MNVAQNDLRGSLSSTLLATRDLLLLSSSCIELNNYVTMSTRIKPLLFTHSLNGKVTFLWLIIKNLNWSVNKSAALDLY